ncbi:MAG: hypothetical protein U0414_14795 [Polyangiaceae bacterium]
MGRMASRGPLRRARSIPPGLRPRSPSFAGLVPLAALLASAACDDSTPSGSGGSTASTGSSTVATSSSKSVTVTATSANSSSSGMAFVCDPPAEPGSLYENSATGLFDVDPTSMCAFRGDVLLIVNTAAV